MRIALCDDEQKDLDTLLRAVQTYDKRKSLETYCFSHAKDLYLSHIEEPFDIIILDIEMSYPNGYEIAQQLVARKPKPLILFLTNSFSYAIRGYGIAYRYLTKPIELSQFTEALDSAIQEICANRFVFSADGTTCVLTLEQLYYFEIINHYLVIHTMDAEYTIRATMTEILSSLPLVYFGMPHQSYLVNFSHINSVRGNEVILTNGARLPLSRRRQTEFTHAFHRYLGR